ncbi:MAG: UpxY family transcription antiterminator [Candidatus Marinimicrobia bacterium]|nr:UpxY family transcription antiterminator [Candidatus Neomarinimicrobiota bacterium]
MPDLSNIQSSDLKSPYPVGDQQKWYAIYVKSRHELKVSESLTQKEIINLVPQIKVVRQWSDRRKTVKIPLFRGYVFVNIDFSKEKFAVLQNYGVVKFIGIKGIPSIIPDHEIRWLDILIENSDTVQYESSLRIGEKVAVIAGPFKGIQGQIIDIRNTTRLLISFESISQMVSIEISPDYLKKIS